jgi:hypothetical protein
VNSGHGGKRDCAGRPVGAVSTAKVRLSQLAREHSDAAFATLADICENGTSEGARISAAVAFLDRGFGKPREAEHRQYSEPSEFDDFMRL